MAQTTITVNPGVGQEGALASALDYQVVSRVAAEAIPVGRFVVLTVDDEDTCELPDATGEATSGRGLGVALRVNSREAADYAAGDQVKILTQGEIWVSTNDAVVAGTAANVSFQTDPLGSFSVAGSVDGNDLATGTYTTSNVAGLNIVKLGGSVHS